MGGWREGLEAAEGVVWVDAAVENLRFWFGEGESELEAASTLYDCRS
jgi:hypothetical protein